ncbi:N-acetylglucosamine-6-phosphate deacetylase [Peribacillus saganii]|uniref:N-acetylglucosamine-6-phosphate deacetylase n=1 Tax=Peribacillus saganii TaxID=2303992 RepID=A0A372LK73_9BACI|nr:N-acetylglucosamine-6-phosphate deacetylase [Peribacillus saganii]RFU66973.1 N-acetylglucosamine-6-phosphate deacetylase [Peribacillus saganii]
MAESRILITNGEIYLENEIIENGYLIIEEGRISNVGPLEQAPNYFDGTFITLQEGAKIVPGFIDVHIHGAAGADTMDATTEALHTLASHLPLEGTTSFLATTITQGTTEIEAALENAAEYMKYHNEPGYAEVLGIHLEGPFINKNRKGAQPEAYILPPDIELFSKWQQMAGDNIRLVTMAPEQQNGIELIRTLSESGVLASIGHSEATYEEVKAAVQAGATHVTHLFNGMLGLHHREPGTAGAALLFDELKAEIISDGIHVRPEMVELAVKAKGIDNIILITDAMRAKCLQSGVYDLGGQQVSVSGDKALLQDCTLAGSILTMIDSVKNMLAFTGLSLMEIIQMASSNPAKQLGVFARKGSIAHGKDADLVILSPDLDVTMTYCRGKPCVATIK